MMTETGVNDNRTKHVSRDATDGDVYTHNAQSRCCPMWGFPQVVLWHGYGMVTRIEIQSLARQP